MSSAEIAVSIKNGRNHKTETQYLVLDTESIPDGRLIAQTKYRGENLSEEEAIQRAQQEARERSPNGSDFLPVSLQYPVAVCVLRLDAGYEILAITCLDAPHFRPPEIAKKFWQGVACYPNAKLVTFNGRGFDMPLLELAAFRYRLYAPGITSSGTATVIAATKSTCSTGMSNSAPAASPAGSTCCRRCWEAWQNGRVGRSSLRDAPRGRLQEINDYCMFDTLDTYFVFLRTRLMTGELSEEGEDRLVMNAKQWLRERAEELPALNRYLEHWNEHGAHRPVGLLYACQKRDNPRIKKYAHPWAASRLLRALDSLAPEPAPDRLQCFPTISSGASSVTATL